MSTPPIVGVPCLTRCPWGPSARTCWPMLRNRSRRIHSGNSTPASDERQHGHQEDLVGRVPTYLRQKVEHEARSSPPPLAPVPSRATPSRAPCHRARARSSSTSEASAAVAQGRTRSGSMPAASAPSAIASPRSPTVTSTSTADRGDLLAQLEVRELSERAEFGHVPENGDATPARGHVAEGRYRRAASRSGSHCTRR